MTKFNANEKEAIILIIKAFLASLKSRIKLEPENEYTGLYKRTYNAYQKLLKNINNFTLKELAYYKDVLQLINIIHNPKVQTEKRDSSAAKLIKALDVLEEKISKIPEEPKFVDLSIDKKPKEPKEPTESLEQLAAKVYAKIDIIKDNISSMPVELIFKARDLNKSNSSSNTITSNYINKISQLYNQVSDIFEKLLDFLEKYYSKNVTQSELQTVIILLNKIIDTLQKINNCFASLTTRPQLLQLYGEAITSTMDLEEYFNKLFQDDKKVILS